MSPILVVEGEGRRARVPLNPENPDRLEVS